MKRYTELEIDCIFSDIWQLWPNKNKEYAARKALAVTLNSGANHKEVVEACKIYSLESEGEELTYHLSNFLLQDHWRDIQGDIKKLEQLREEGRQVIEAWNKACRPHWARVEDIELRIPMATNALKNNSFRKYWKISLDKARRIFKNELHEGDSRSKIILSFRWFTNVSHDKHTVLRLFEGELGQPPVDIAKRKQKENKEVDWNERKEIAEYFRKLRAGEISDGDTETNSDKEDGDFELY